MSDHWKALADLLGTPPLDRGTVEPYQDVEATKSSEKTVDSGSVVKANELRESKPAFSNPVVDKISEMEEGVSSEMSSTSTSYQQPKAVENQKNMEEKNSVTPAVPKRSAGWDALARLFGLSAPPPDADVPLPESPKEKEPEARTATVNPPAAKQAPTPKPAPVSKPVDDELDLTQLGWPAPKQPKNDAGRERSSQQDRTSGPETVREPAARDTQTRESSARESGSRESGGRERGGRDSGREGGNRDRNERDRNERGRRPEREAAAVEPAVRDRGSRDSNPREIAAPRDSVAAREHATQREAEPRESGRRERGGRDRGPRDGSQRENASRESGSREARETPVRDAGTRDVVAREPGDGERNDRRGGRHQHGGRHRDGRSVERRGERSPERGDSRNSETRRDDSAIYDEPFVEVDADDVDDLSFGPPRGRAEKPRPVAPAWEDEAEADFEEVSDEGEMPERRGRRRRGRRRGGAGRSETGRSETGRGETGRGETAEGRPSTRPEDRDNRSKRDITKRAIEDVDLDYEAEVVDDAPIDDLVAPIEPAASERRGRRRRRRGGRRQETSVGPDADLDSDELDLSEGYNLPSLLADEIEASEDDDERHAKIPTWEETLKILVTTNIEARHRPDQKGGGGRHGGGHHGGQGGGHGSGGGRGRGGNRNQGKR